MNMGLVKSSLAIAASIVAICSLSVAAVGSQIFIADETQVIVSAVAVEPISAVSATVVQEDGEAGESPAQGGAKETFSVQTSKKTANETWLEYLTRLKSMKLISDAQIRQWKSGKTIKIKREMPVQRIRRETRRTETRNYTVKIPYTELVSIDVTIPTIGSQPDDSPFTGVADEFSTDSDQAPPAKNKLLNNVAMIKPMMQIRPTLTSDAVFSEYQPAEFDRLRIRRLGPDSKGFELIDSKTQDTVRKFLDTNNDN